MQTPTRSRLIGIVLLAASIVVLLCFLATSLHTAVFLLAGALLAGAVYVLAQAARLLWRMATHGQRRLVLALAAMAALAIVAVALSLTRSSPRRYPMILTEDVNVRSYSLALRPAEGGTLTAVEDAVIDLQPGGGRADHQAADAAQGVDGDGHHQRLASARGPCVAVIGRYAGHAQRSSGDAILRDRP